MFFASSEFSPLAGSDIYDGASGVADLVLVSGASCCLFPRTHYLVHLDVSSLASKFLVVSVEFLLRRTSFLYDWSSWAIS